MLGGGGSCRQVPPPRFSSRLILKGALWLGKQGEGATLVPNGGSVLPSLSYFLETGVQWWVVVGCGHYVVQPNPPPVVGHCGLRMK